MKVIRRKPLLSIVLLLCVHTVAAEPQARQDRETLDFEALIQSAPPELRIDLLLRALDKGAIHPTKKLEMRLLTEAFADSSGASEPFRMQMLPGSWVDTRTNYLAAGLNSGIDSVSLRARILLHLVRLSPPNALALLRTSAPPSPPSLSCNQAWTWNVDLYYSAVQALATSSFSDKDIKQGKRASFLEEYALSLTSASQITPAARLLMDASLTTDELSELVSTFATNLGSLRDGDRAFSLGATDGTDFILYKLYPRCERGGVDARSLVEGVRSFLVANSQSPKCADNGFRGSELPAYGEKFNSFLRSNPDLRVQPLSIDELSAPVAPDSKAKPDKFEASVDNSKDLLKRLQAVESTNRSDDPITWDSEFREIVSDVASATDEGSPDRFDMFATQCSFLRHLVDKAPTEEDRRVAARACVLLLSSSPVMSQSPPIWLLKVRDLLIVLKGDELGTVKEGGNAVLAAYARVMDSKDAIKEQ